MAKHRGIGATVASVVIFSVLLISNLAIFVASQDRAKLYSQADAEDALSDGALLAAGAGGANVLAKAQTLVGTGSLDCSSAERAIRSAIGMISDSQTAGELNVTVSAEMAPGGSAGDNMTILAPFNGWVSGDLDIALHMAATGAMPLAGVSLHKSETHFVHLGVHLEAEVSDCLSAVTAVTQRLSSAALPNCTTVAIGPLFEQASRGPAQQAVHDGFEFGLSYGIVPSSTCSVSFSVSLVQARVQGISGVFSVRVVEGGVVSMEPRVSQQQA